VWAWFAYDLAGLIGHSVATRPDLDLRRFLATGCWLPELREKTTDAALRAQCDAVLYLDSDMRFPTNALVRLLAHDQPVVAANYTTRRPPFHPVSVRNFGGERVYTEADSTGLEAVAATGMGCMLVRADVLREVKPPRFMMGYVPDDRAHVGEDLYFCKKLGDIGVPILIDHELSNEVTHIGVVEFEAAHAVASRESLQARATPKLEVVS
jgi:hypothetical protein